MNKCVFCDAPLKAIPIYAIMHSREYTKLGKEPVTRGTNNFHAAGCCLKCWRNPQQRSTNKVHFSIPKDLASMLKYAGSSTGVGTPVR